MGIQEKIKEIEREMERTQKNKATEYHLGQLKAKLAKLRTQLLEPDKKSSGGRLTGLPSACESASREQSIGAQPFGQQLRSMAFQKLSVNFSCRARVPYPNHISDGDGRKPGFALSLYVLCMLSPDVNSK